MLALPQQPSSVNDLLFASFKLYSESFTKLIGYSVIIFAIHRSLSIFTGDFIPTNSTLPPDEQLANLIQIMPSLLGILFIGVLGSLVFYSAMIYRIDNVANKREDDFVGVLLLAVKKFPTIAVAGILYTIAIMIGGLLVIPALILITSLSFFGYFILLEDKSGYESLMASHRLVWGDWWRTNWVFFVPSLLFLLFFLGIGFLFTLVMGSNATSSTLLTIGTEFLTAVFTPYFYVIGYLQYHDLKLRKKM